MSLPHIGHRAFRPGALVRIPLQCGQVGWPSAPTEPVSVGDVGAGGTAPAPTASGRIGGRRAVRWARLDPQLKQLDWPGMLFRPQCEHTIRSIPCCISATLPPLAQTAASSETAPSSCTWRRVESSHRGGRRRPPLRSVPYFAYADATLATASAASAMSASPRVGWTSSQTVCAPILIAVGHSTLL